MLFVLIALSEKASRPDCLQNFRLPVSCDAQA